MEILLPLLQACTALQAGEPTRLSHRGSGLRLVLDVHPTEGPAGARQGSVAPGHVNGPSSECLFSIPGCE